MKLEKIYEHCEKIFAQKGKDSTQPDKKFVHTFRRGAQIFGLPDGSILIKNKYGHRLWKKFAA